MNTSSTWDAEQRPSAPAPSGHPTPIPSTYDHTDVDPGGSDPRRTALARALESLDAGLPTVDAVTQILAALDAADTESGIARVDTADAVLQQRIARIVSGAALPSRGPSTRAREILELLGDGGTA